MGQMLLIYIWIIMNRDPAGRQYLVKCHSLVTRETRPSCFIPHLAIDQEQSIAPKHSSSYKVTITGYNTHKVTIRARLQPYNPTTKNVTAFSETE